MTQLIYHITDRESWAHAEPSGVYVHPSLHREGFIHCSFKAQLEETANLYFNFLEEILIISIDPARLKCPLKVETSGVRGEFPHIYGPLNASAVVGTTFIRKEGTAFSVNV